MLGRAHDSSRAFEWIKLVLSLFVIPLMVTVIDLREGKALQAAELINMHAELAQLKSELSAHAESDALRIEKVDGAQREVENNLTRVITTLENTGKQIDEALRVMRLGRGR